jgi:hypothetical protein
MTSIRYPLGGTHTLYRQARWRGFKLMSGRRFRPRSLGTRYGRLRPCTDPENTRLSHLQNCRTFCSNLKVLCVCFQPFGRSTRGCSHPPRLRMSHLEMSNPNLSAPPVVNHHLVKDILTIKALLIIAPFRLVCYLYIVKAGYLLVLALFR